ncbi:MAG: CDP-alcohol phosphatidyltransferase family protein [Candidatus Bathyarchaeota archaeon]|nr:CDP-alcohol phosphatidyltransferase family protein [Candidatus Bathyarchaeota archaeon]
MLTKLKQRIQQMLTTEAKIAHKLGLTPNRISIIGFVLAIASAITYALVSTQSPWLLLLATFFLLASGFSDALDGIVARTFKQTTAFGGFFDSVLDRYADVLVFSGIIIASLTNDVFNHFWTLLIGLAALSGSVLVSYTRARAEAAGIKMESVGLAERAERMLILAATSIVAYFYMPAFLYGIALIAILANLTVVQRLLHVYKILKKET